MTSRVIASIAGKTLRNPDTSKEIKSIAASDLAQARRYYRYDERYREEDLLTYKQFIIDCVYASPENIF